MLAAHEFDLIRIKDGSVTKASCFFKIGNDVMHRYLIGIGVLLFGFGSLSRTQLFPLEGAPPAYYVTIFGSGSPSEIMDTNYPSLFPSSFLPFGGRYIIHFGTQRRFDGQAPEEVVVVQFDNMHQLLAWHSSEAFKQLYDVHKSGYIRAFAVEGVVEPHRQAASGGY
jgi:uncharacterized protein (DUF1330 family)